MPQPIVSGVSWVDIPYGQDSEKHMTGKPYHGDPATKQVVYDE